MQKTIKAKEPNISTFFNERKKIEEKRAKKKHTIRSLHYLLQEPDQCWNHHNSTWEALKDRSQVQKESLHNKIKAVILLESLINVDNSRKKKANFPRGKTNYPCFASEVHARSTDPIH